MLVMWYCVVDRLKWQLSVMTYVTVGFVFREAMVGCRE